MNAKLTVKDLRAILAGLSEDALVQLDKNANFDKVEDQYPNVSFAYLIPSKVNHNGPEVLLLSDEQLTWVGEPDIKEIWPYRHEPNVVQTKERLPQILDLVMEIIRLTSGYRERDHEMKSRKVGEVYDCASELNSHLTAYLAQPKSDVEALKDALHEDQTGLARRLELVKKFISGFGWAAEGRGSYQWDDPKFYGEMANLIEGAIKLIDEGLANSGKKAHALCCGRGSRQTIMELIEKVERNYFRTTSDIGANLNTTFIWNRVRDFAGLPPIGDKDLPYWDESKKTYVVPAFTRLLPFLKSESFPNPPTREDIAEPPIAIADFEAEKITVIGLANDRMKVIRNMKRYLRGQPGHRDLDTGLEYEYTILREMVEHLQSDASR